MTPTAEAMYNNTNDFSDIDFWYIENIFPTIPKIKKTRQNKNDNFVDEIIHDKEQLVKLNEGPKLAGNVSQEFLMTTMFMKKIKWAEYYVVFV